MLQIKAAEHLTEADGEPGCSFSNEALCFIIVGEDLYVFGRIV